MATIGRLRFVIVKINAISTFLVRLLWYSVLRVLKLWSALNGLPMGTDLLSAMAYMERIGKCSHGIPYCHSMILAHYVILYEYEKAKMNALQFSSSFLMRFISCWLSFLQRLSSAFIFLWAYQISFFDIIIKTCSGSPLGWNNSPCIFGITWTIYFQRSPRRKRSHKEEGRWTCTSMELHREG